MEYDLKIENELYLFNKQVEYLLINKKTCKLDEVKEVRTNQQNKSRWKYLQMISDILNERGELFTPPHFKIEVPYSKELLYNIVWLPAREYMFSNKEKQLNTKEFCQLVEVVQMFFAKNFNINIEFPHIEIPIPEER